jgi:hypothetical protein
VPALPDEMADATPMLLSALHETGRSAARDPGKYALRRVQVRGRAGKLVATDGKMALVQSGFAFPFGEDLLVPAVPVFGAKELAAQDAIKVGRTGAHLVITAGPWTVWLGVDAQGRFPDVEGAVPRSRLGTTLDVELPTALADILRGLPGENDDEGGPVTLDLGPGLVVRARGNPDEPAAEVPVPDAVVTGPPVVVVANRRHLLRALALGFRQFKFTTPDRPWVATDPTRQFLSASLDPQSAVRPDGEGDPRQPARVHDPDSTPTPTEGSTMPGPSNGSTNGHPAADRTNDAPDPLAEAEALKAALAGAHHRASKLVAALRGFRKQHKTVSSALASLRSLRLE